MAFLQLVHLDDLVYDGLEGQQPRVVLDETQYLPFIRALAVAIKASIVHGDAPDCQSQPNRLF
jgi:hypothetical protein